MVIWPWLLFHETYWSFFNSSICRIIFGQSIRLVFHILFQYFLFVTASDWITTIRLYKKVISVVSRTNSFKKREDAIIHHESIKVTKMKVVVCVCILLTTSLCSILITKTISNMSLNMIWSGKTDVCRHI